MNEITGVTGQVNEAVWLAVAGWSRTLFCLPVEPELFRIRQNIGWEGVGCTSIEMLVSILPHKPTHLECKSLNFSTGTELPVKIFSPRTELLIKIISPKTKLFIKLIIIMYLTIINHGIISLSLSCSCSTGSYQTTSPSARCCHRSGSSARSPGTRRRRSCTSRRPTGTCCWGRARHTQASTPCPSDRTRTARASSDTTCSRRTPMAVASSCSLKTRWCWGRINGNENRRLKCYPTLTNGSKWQITKFWDIGVLRLALACSTSRLSFELKHSSCWKTFKSRHHDITLRIM